MRFPYPPVTAAVGTSNVSEIARRLGVSRRTVHRWKAGGIPPGAADRVAVTAGHHPANVWPDEWHTYTKDPDT